MSYKEDNIIKDYLKKTKLIDKYNKAYYGEDAPVITDQKFDKLKKETLELEAKHTFLKKYAELYTEKMHSENLNLYGVRPEKLLKKIPDIFYLTDAEGLSFFEFKFKDDKLISIIYQNNNWE